MHAVSQSLGVPASVFADKLAPNGKLEHLDFVEKTIAIEFSVAGTGWLQNGKIGVQWQDTHLVNGSKNGLNHMFC